jgi:hypothetical protein
MFHALNPTLPHHPRQHYAPWRMRLSVWGLWGSGCQWWWGLYALTCTNVLEALCVRPLVAVFRSLTVVGFADGNRYVIHVA